jgi:pyrroloquinoline quinone (PQQ) biosynthesis protein C
MSDLQGYRPRLRHCTMLDSGPTIPLRLIVGTTQYDLSELEGNRNTFLKMKSLLDGRHTLKDISTILSMDILVVEDAVAQLKNTGLLRREAETSLIDTTEFMSRVSETLIMWRRQIGFHRIFQQLARGEARVEVLQGLFIETYHVVNMAAKHISVAISHADNDFFRGLLSRYLAEEYNHSELILSTCDSLGVSKIFIRESQPTIGTLSLVNMLSELGRSDTIAYLAATSLFEAVPADAHEGRASIAAICEAYGLEEKVFSGAMAHLSSDVDANHSSLLAEALRETVHVPVDRVHHIINLLHDLKHAFDQHHDGIIQYYSDISNYIPRLRVDYFSL